MKKDITAALLRAYLLYDPISGDFTWISKKLASKRISIGDIAGRTIQGGYIQIGIEGKYYLAHRLAFLYMTGSWPQHSVDHINGNTRDNRWQNLREATPQQNARNVKRVRINTSGVTGVSWGTKVSKWIVRIGHNGKQIHIGCFTTIEEAAAARKSAEHLYEYHPNHGTSR